MIKQTLSCLSGLLILALAGKAQNNYNEISLPDLMKKRQQGDRNMVIVDVRTNGEYYDSVSRNKQSNIGRIKGAMHIELRNLQENPDAIKQLEAYKDKEIYLICSHSYRSRSASNILLRNGFAHVNNVQGGMTEWYRRYDEMARYMNAFYETSTAYKNMSPAQLANDLLTGRNPLLLGILSTPRFFWDSATKRSYDYYPVFKNAGYFNYGDSLQVLEKVQKEKGRPIVLFNMVNNGAAEIADWLTQKGIPDVHYLVGGNYYFYEYASNKQLVSKLGKYLVQKNTIRFITPVNYCGRMASSHAQLVDLRHDTLFNKKTSGIKRDYRYVQGSASFFNERGEQAFGQMFPDKKKEYVLMSQNGITGLELADTLAKKGYKIYWMMGGLQRLEWYTINVEDFNCKNILIE